MEKEKMVCSKCGKRIEKGQNCKRVYEMTPIMYPQSKIYCNDCLKKGRIYFFIFIAISALTLALFISLKVGILE